MSHSDSYPPYTEAVNQAMHAELCQTELAGPARISKSPRKIASTSTKTPVSVPPASPTLRNPANRLSNKRIQREIFMQHLKDWASNHDSSIYFRGSISLHPQGTFPGEVVELGKSISCILTDASSGDSPKKIVVRLFQSHRYDNNGQQQKVRGRKDTGQSITPYQLVIRSGSGWMPARQYLDKYYFTHRTRSVREKEAASQRPASTSSNANAQRPARANLTANFSWATPTLPPALANMTGNNQPSAWISLNLNNVAFNLSNTQPPAWASLTANNSNLNNTNRVAEVNTPPKQLDQDEPHSARSKHTGSLFVARDTVKISPLFRSFLRLPQELQDEILYQAVGYTRTISLTCTVHVRHASSSRSPSTISKLFRISRSINEHMGFHIFRSTNFHFGITGFTKFLWQLGPINRSNLQHLTFHFGKASLLHCIRWLAPDPIWELFEPPVATNPSTLTYFWRCQLQDLMKELNLSTLTVDIRDVPLEDVPMLVKIMNTAMGNVERIRVIDNHVRTGILVEEFTQDLHTRFQDMLYPTWRELSLQYHNDYKHQRWHMRHALVLHDVDSRLVLDTWMNKDKAFFDS